MSKNNNNWPAITNIFQQAKPNQAGTFAALCFFITRGLIVAVVLAAGFGRLPSDLRMFNSVLVCTSA